MAEYIEREAMRRVLEAASINPRFADEPTAADVEPVRHGRWEFIGPYAYNGDGLIGGCSVCKKRIRFFEVPNCCPHCGAKMDLDCTE